ncbi:MAG: hypothetical protein ACTSWE_09470, partial [Promethearchaeota archaeon]
KRKKRIKLSRVVDFFLIQLLFMKIEVDLPLYPMTTKINQEKIKINPNSFKLYFLLYKIILI